MKPYAEAIRMMPKCCAITYDNLQSDSHGAEHVQDIIDAVEHELQLWKEGQDGCISGLEAAKCVAFLRWVRKR